MIIFEHVIIESLRQLQSHTDRLSKEARRKKKRFREIEFILSAIEGDFSKFEKLVPPITTDRIEAVHRHIWFVRKGMREQNVGWIEHNAADLNSVDIPLLKKKLIKYFREFEFLPTGLRVEVAPLLENGEYDSAVRKAFLVLKQSAIDKHRMSKSIDGEDMVNFLFSEGGRIKVHDDKMRRKAFRDFTSGFFRFFRNEYMHTLGSDTQTSAQCVLSVIAHLLQVVEK